MYSEVNPLNAHTSPLFWILLPYGPQQTAGERSLGCAAGPHSLSVLYEVLSRGWTGAFHSALSLSFRGKRGTGEQNRPFSNSPGSLLRFFVFKQPFFSLSCYYSCFLLAALCSMWDLSSLTGDRTHIPQPGRWSLNTGPPGKSWELVFFVCLFKFL